MLKRVKRRSQHVTNALFGLQSLGDSKEVRQLVVALTTKVTQCRAALEARQVGNALYGLQSLRDSEEVRPLLAALTPKVRKCHEWMEGAHIGKALYGLQRMGNSHEVLQLVAALTLKVKECCKVLDVDEVSNVLYGLQGFEDSVEVRELLAALTTKVKHCLEKLDAHVIELAKDLLVLGDSQALQQFLAALGLNSEILRTGGEEGEVEVDRDKSCQDLLKVARGLTKPLSTPKESRTWGWNHVLTWKTRMCEQFKL